MTSQLKTLVLMAALSAVLIVMGGALGGQHGILFALVFAVIMNVGDSRIYCLRNGLPLDQDVYDAAEWSCLTELSGLSIAYGSMPVEVPDFTRGDWNKVQGYRHAVKQ